MTDLMDLRVFERVAALSSFSAAADALEIPKSSASRAVARLEQSLGIRLLQRTTREVALTTAGEALLERCGTLLAGIDEALVFTSGLAGTPRGTLTISAGIGVGINVLGAQLPGFLERYPEVRVSIDLTSRMAELVADRVDIAIRMGPLPDSSLVATRLGSLTQYLCASTSHLDAHGRPSEPDDLASFDLIDFPALPGKARSWRLERDGQWITVEPRLRVEVNDALTICALVGHGAGIGALSAYLCGHDIKMGRLERVLPQWALPPLPVNLIFPSRREVAPAVRAFVDYMREANAKADGWLADPVSEQAATQ
jgi:LysR family transcriptional regulator for bpeEF and oprC